MNEVRGDLSTKTGTVDCRPTSLNTAESNSWLLDTDKKKDNVFLTQ